MCAVDGTSNNGRPSCRPPFMTRIDPTATSCVSVMSRWPEDHEMLTLGQSARFATTSAGRRQRECTFDSFLGKRNLSLRAAPMLTYDEYKNAVLLAIIEAETYGRPALNLAGRVDVSEAVRQAGLEVKENWIRDAVRSFEALGFVSNVLRPIQPPRIFLKLTREGRLRRSG
jgi:hypothetical protein